MAAVRSGNLSVEEVLTHDLFNHGSTNNSESSIALKELNKPIKPAPILLKEARRWLSGIRRRIGGKQKDPKSILRGDKSRLSV